MDSFIAGVITALVSACVGAGLTYFVNSRLAREQFNQQRRDRTAQEVRNAHNLYQLLGRELQYNRDAAATLWAEIAGEEKRAADDTSAMDRAYRLSEWYMPTWSFVFWRSHAAQVADTLSEDQVYQVLEIQSQLEQVNNIHVRLARLRANFDTYIQQPPPNMDSQQLERTKREAAHLLEHQMITEYHEFERVIQSLLAGDGPLVEDRWCEAATPTGPYATR